MTIKVLVISDYRDYHSSRPEANIFIGLAKLGFQINIMSFSDTELKNEFESVGIRYINFHPLNKWDKEEIMKIRNFIIKENIEIVHLFNSAAIVNGIQAAKGLSVKVVLYRGYSANIHWYDPSAYFKYLHPRVDKIFCNSKGVEEHIQKQLFFNKSKTITINKGHNIDWYKSYMPYDIKKELGIDENSFLLVNVANNRRMKGIPYLLKAFNLLPTNLPIHLLLIGKDMDTQQNLSIINKANKKNNVHILGFRKNVLDIVSSCNVFVLSSIKGEAITKAVIEAMSLKVAPIISDIAGNRELVENEESCLVTPAKNVKELSKAILRLYDDRKMCKKLGENAQKRIKTHLNTEQTILKTKNLYEELLSK